MNMLVLSRMTLATNCEKAFCSRPESNFGKNNLRNVVLYVCLPNFPGPKLIGTFECIAVF